MKIFLSVAALAAVSFSQAQGLATNWDAKAREFSPVLTYPVAEFDKLLWFTARNEILLFGGAEFRDGLLTGGGAWVLKGRLAMNESVRVEGFVGPSLTFQQGKPTALGIVFGVRW